jgi:Nuclease-related domain
VCVGRHEESPQIRLSPTTDRELSQTPNSDVDSQRTSPAIAEASRCRWCLHDPRSGRGGSSADRIFRDARRHWRMQLRLRLFAMLAAGVVLSYLVRRYSPHGAFFAGACVGAIFAIALWVWDAPPPFVERWRQGRDGERATEMVLRRLCRDGWSVRHDLAGKYGNLDHVVVGPGGVFLLDSKNPWGVVQDRGRRLDVPSRGRTTIRLLDAEAAALAARRSAEAGDGAERRTRVDRGRAAGRRPMGGVRGGDCTHRGCAGSPWGSS